MTTRPTLPQNYIYDSGTLLDDFEATTGWVPDSISSIELSIAHVRSGSASCKVWMSVSGYKSCQITKTFNFYLLNDGLLEVWFYVDGEINYMKGVYVTLGQSGSFTKIFGWSQIDSTPGTSFVSGWNRVLLSVSDFAASGGASLSDPITGVRLTFTYYTNDQVCDIYVDSLMVNRKTRAQLLITFDDNDPTVDTVAFPIMDAYGIRGTRYVISDYVGEVNNSTLEQLQILDAAGWAICNHTMTHPDLTSLSPADAAAEISGCSSYLISNGFTRGAYHFAYPGHNHNASVRATAESCGILTARNGYLANYMFGAYPNLITSEDLRYRLPLRHEVQNTKSLADVEASIDDALQRGITLVILFHGLTEVAGAYTWSIANFQALMDYIAARKIRCITIDEWYNGLTNPRYRSLPVTRAVT